MCFAFLDQSPLLPSLSALIQALQQKDTKNGLLASVDIQDFHLPDEDFGQLKLARLRLSTSLVEPFVQRVYNTRRSNRRQSDERSNSEVLSEELFNPEPPICSVLEDSLPLCQSDHFDQSQTDSRNTDKSEKHVDPVNKPNSRSSNRMDSVQEQTWTIVPTETQEAIIVRDQNTVKIQTSGTENINVLNLDPEVESQTRKQTDSHTLSENSSLCPVLLDLSPSLTSRTQRAQDPALPSLGMTPHFLSPGSPTDRQPHLLSPPDSCRSPSSDMPKGCVSPDLVSSKTFANVNANSSTKRLDSTKVKGDKETQNQTEAQNNVKPKTPPQNVIAKGHEYLRHENSFDTENNPQFKSKTDCTPEIEPQALSESAAQLIFDTQNTQNTSTSQKTEDKMVCTSNADKAMGHDTDPSITKTLLNESVPSTTFPSAGHRSSMLQEVHTFKVVFHVFMNIIYKMYL